MIFNDNPMDLVKTFYLNLMIIPTCCLYYTGFCLHEMDFLSVGHFVHGHYGQGHSGHWSLMALTSVFNKIFASGQNILRSLPMTKTSVARMSVHHTFWLRTFNIR